MLLKSNEIERYSACFICIFEWENTVVIRISIEEVSKHNMFHRNDRNKFASSIDMLTQQFHLPQIETVLL